MITTTFTGEEIQIYAHISAIFVLETKKLGRTGSIPVIASWLSTSICSGFPMAAIPRSNPKPLMLLALADLYVLKSAKVQWRRGGGDGAATFEQRRFFFNFFSKINAKSNAVAFYFSI